MKKAHIILLIIGSIFISLSIFHSNIWFDEAYSVGMANQTLTDIWNIGGHDVHPVLYYWMLRIVALLTNYSIIAYRIFSAIPIYLLGIIGYTHIKKDFGEKTGILFSFFSYFLPIMAVYANQIRMYSWAILFVIIFCIYAYRIYKGDTKNKNWAIFLLTSLASIFIHYYGLMAAGLISLFLLISFIKNKRKKETTKLIIFGIIQVALYIPWLIYFVNQLQHVSKGFWIGFQFPLTVFELIGCQQTGNMQEWVGTIANILIFIVLAISLYKSKKENKIDTLPVKLSIGLYLAVIIAALLITLVLKTSILYYRYLFVITGLYIFTLSYILGKEKNKYIIYSVCILTLILAIISNVMQIKENYASKNGEQIKYLKENIKEDDILVYRNIGNGSVFAVNFKSNKQYFYNPENWGIEEAYRAFGPQMETYTTTEFLEKCIGRIWIIDSEDNGYYNELFNNENFTHIITEKIVTKYQGYIYNITLVVNRDMKF